MATMKDGKSIAVALLAGAIGSVLSQKALLVAYPRLDYLLLALAAATGAFAAGVGVYVVAALEAAQPSARIFFFAAVCGFAAPTVLSNAVDSLYKRNPVAELGSLVATTTAEFASTHSLAPSSVEELMKGSIGVVEAASRLPPSGVKSSETALKGAIVNLANSAQASSEPRATVAIIAIGHSAREQSLDRTADAAIQSLRQVADTPGAASSVRANAQAGVEQLRAIADWATAASAPDALGSNTPPR